jgi:hypothetical protein
MTAHHAASRPTMAYHEPPRPTFTPAQAHADRVERARSHASNCILMAVVTSPMLSAELIDLAIEYTHRV